MLSLDPDDKIILDGILQTFPHPVYAYGSRVKGTHKKFSDLDLCIMDNLRELELFNLQTALEESDLSIKVDIRLWNHMQPSFRNLIQNDLIQLT